MILKKWEGITNIVMLLRSDNIVMIVSIMLDMSDIWPVTVSQPNLPHRVGFCEDKMKENTSHFGFPPR